MSRLVAINRIMCKGEGMADPGPMAQQEARIQRGGQKERIRNIAHRKQEAGKQASREREKEGPAAIAIDDMTHLCKSLTSLGTKQEALRTTCSLSLSNLNRGTSL